MATAAASLLYNVGQSIGFIHRNLHALVALVFLVLPQLVLRRRGNIERYGFTTQPLGLGLTVAAVAIVVVLPLFVGGFIVAVRTACAHAPQLVPGSCYRAAHPLWRLPGDFPHAGGGAAGGGRAARGAVLSRLRAGAARGGAAADAERCSARASAGAWIVTAPRCSRSATTS